MGFFILGADDHAKVVEIVGLALRGDDSDASHALLCPLASDPERRRGGYGHGPSERALQVGLVASDFIRQAQLPLFAAATSGAPFRIRGTAAQMESASLAVGSDHRRSSSTE
jgi:hypothetical protein